MLLIKGQLLAKEQILRGQGRSRENASSQKPDSITNKTAENSGRSPDSLEDSAHRLQSSHPHSEGNSTLLTHC
jgi:hypothetical protein